MITHWIGQRVFSTVHTKNLVYNTCWEDPRLDREALQLGPTDTVMVITSAGCNALDYVLQAPAAVHAVDMNPLQNALLELKLASIRALGYKDFFDVFGRGRHHAWRHLYHSAVRQHLPENYRRVWDKRLTFFDGSSRRKSFYFRGTSGTFAWMVNGYLRRHKGLRDAMLQVIDATSLQQQVELCDAGQVEQRLWSRRLRWFLRRDTTMAMLGVPRSQRKQIDDGYPGGIARFVEDRVNVLLKQLPLQDNYFWRVYLTGSYTPDCCPEYLKPDNFERLKAGLVDRVQTHTATVEQFLRHHPGQISRYVLLDHMDWLQEHRPDLLASEWQAIVDRAAPHARVMWRSAALNVDFVDPLKVTVDGRQHRVGELLSYDRDLAARLHARDRVHTYGSCCIADLQCPPMEPTRYDDRSQQDALLPEAVA
ncbi:DUF3419 family protein [Roseimaritima ulvae]|uniref:S-adenosylmethionine:diacylglycerol 3-amino-3-carboxypropyl transferase n=1 Tax=Roseimaritima ulvae TaxID=980254 RepID=A0A5B9QWF1_9BACT|nr:BtaA family protein [Roseimaritima ulvae]QEG41705.1 hypothetical protein UC8_37310 [Roseimaritima ulvae]